MSAVHHESANIGSRADAFLAVVGKKQGAIKGECETPGHIGEIAVLAWRWSVSSPTAHGTTSATGRRIYEVLEVDKLVDGSSTRLLNSLATNEELKNVKLGIRKAGTSDEEFMVMTLELARIVSSAMRSSPYGGLYETVAFAYQKIQIDYHPQQSIGLRGAQSSFTDQWNQAV